MFALRKEKYVLIFAHLAGWVAFMSLPVFNAPVGWQALMVHPGIFIWNNLLLIAYFYLNLWCLVPRFLSNKKIILYVGINVLVFLFICIVIPGIIRQIFFANPPFAPDFPFPEQRPPFSPDAGFRPRMNPHEMMRRLGIYTHATQFLIVFIVSTGLKVISQWYNEKQRLKELENSKVEAELSFLKSQIHPHFLFNSLNGIYYLALSKDDKAPKAILSLSNFLRFVTIESDKNLIPLEKEIKMLNEYLNLQSLRASEKFDLQVNLTGDFTSLEIMPLTFIPFVENAFKYGISAHVDCFIHLSIGIEKGILEFTIKNSIFQGQKDIVTSSGIGLENIKKRLELAYSERYTLDIKSDSEVYSVFLKINLV